MAYFSMREFAATFLIPFLAQYGLFQYEGHLRHILNFISGKIWLIPVRRKLPSYSQLHFRHNMAYFSTRDIAVTFLTSFQVQYGVWYPQAGHGSNVENHICSLSVSLH
jgi:hypothetical protein